MATKSITLSTTQRSQLRDLIPPQRCSALSSQTGGPCQRFAILGGSVCRSHGGAAPQTRAMADAKVRLAMALAEGGPGRSAPAVLIDAMHTLDLVAGNAKAGLITDPANPALAAELVAAVRDAASLAKALVDLGIDATGVQAEQIKAVEFVLTVAAADLGLPLSDARISKAVGAAFRELDAMGADVDDRARAVKRVADRLEADREAAAAAERDRAAAAAAELRTRDRAAYMIELKRAARQGRPCPVCDIPAPAVKAIGTAPHSAQDPSVGAGGPLGRGNDQLGPQARSDVSGSDPDEAAGTVLTGELLPADPRRHASGPMSVCPGCRGDRTAPGHDQQCGYATASTDPQRGRPWIP